MFFACVVEVFLGMAFDKVVYKKSGWGDCMSKIMCIFAFLNIGYGRRSTQTGGGGGNASRISP